MAVNWNSVLAAVAQCVRDSAASRLRSSASVWTVQVREVAPSPYLTLYACESQIRGLNHTSTRTLTRSQPSAVTLIPVQRGQVARSSGTSIDHREARGHARVAVLTSLYEESTFRQGLPHTSRSFAIACLQAQVTAT